MIRIFCMALLGVLAYQTPAIAGNDKPITVRELPARAKQVVNTHLSQNMVNAALRLTPSY